MEPDIVCKPSAFKHHVTGDDIMKEMTDEEADYWDEYYTKNPPRVDPARNGGFAKQSFRMVALDRLSENYLLTRAIADSKTPTEIIGEMVRERLAAISREEAAIGR